MIALETQHPLAAETRPTRAEAEAAVRTLLAFTGEDPHREGLKDTPARVVRSFEERCRGYQDDPRRHLLRTFEEVAGYDEMIVLTDIPLVSTCEHHLLPIIGRAHIGYIPRGRVVGISKLARVVQDFAARLQIQEKLTSEIAAAIDEVLEPAGVGVAIQASHACMTVRGVRSAEASLSTSRLLGRMRDDPGSRAEFLRRVGQ